MTLEQTQRRRQAVATIHDIVSAMRAIAAGRIQAAQRALAGARRYEQVVLRGTAAALAGAETPDLPFAGGHAPTLLVLTSEQPLCGAFNQNVLALAERRWQELCRAGPVHLVVVGQRGRRQLAGRGLVPDDSAPAATSLHGLRDLVKHLAGLIGRRITAGTQGPLHVVYSRYQSVTEQVPTEERVLPPDLDRIRQLAPARGEYWRYLARPVLLAGLLREYAFISLYRAAADSYASEQASRLVSMDGATRNTERILQALTNLERRERQGQITREVLELIGARFVVQ
jgi:F-type H+-transporting ATPase subunit gamma